MYKRKVYEGVNVYEEERCMKESMCMTKEGVFYREGRMVFVYCIGKGGWCLYIV